MYAVLSFAGVRLWRGPQLRLPHETTQSDGRVHAKYRSLLSPIHQAEVVWAAAVDADGGVGLSESSKTNADRRVQTESTPRGP